MLHDLFPVFAHLDGAHQTSADAAAHALLQRYLTGLAVFFANRRHRLEHRRGAAGTNLVHLGDMRAQQVGDKALSSRLPVIIYKPNCVLSQAIYRIAEKVIAAEPRYFDDDFTNTIDSATSFMQAEEDANDDYNLKLSGLNDLIGSGQLSTAELIDMIKTQAYEIGQLRKENNLLKSKIVKAAQQGFRL